MSRKIIGVTVGTTLPKPNFKQTDPTKGDYIKNKPDFDGLKNKVNVVSDLVGDKSVSEQISLALAEISSDNVVHGDAKALLSNIIETYILNIDYSAIQFDVSEIVGQPMSSAQLGMANLGTMILGNS